MMNEHRRIKRDFRRMARRNRKNWVRQCGSHRNWSDYGRAAIAALDAPSGKADDVLALVRPYAPVLQRMVELLGADPGLKFGAALDLAALECGFHTLPLDVERALLSATYAIVGSGRIEGCPDA